MKPAEMVKKTKLPRVRLAKEKRERLIRAYVERMLVKDGSLPSQRQVSQAVGGNIYSILTVLKEYRENGI